jgi:dihydroxy-acid dehydratase
MNATGLETRCALVTDGKISGFARGPFIGQVSPEAVEGGLPAILQDGDLIESADPSQLFMIFHGNRNLVTKLWSMAIHGFHQSSLKIIITPEN